VRAVFQRHSALVPASRSDGEFRSRVVLDRHLLPAIIEDDFEEVQVALSDERKKLAGDGGCGGVTNCG
jgi:hypothetical protein